MDDLHQTRSYSTHSQQDPLSHNGKTLTPLFIYVVNAYCRRLAYGIRKL